MGSTQDPVQRTDGARPPGAAGAIHFRLSAWGRKRAPRISAYADPFYLKLVSHTATLQLRWQIGSDEDFPKKNPCRGRGMEGLKAYRLTARLVTGARVGVTSTGTDLEVGVKDPSPMLSMATRGLVSG